MKRAWLMCSHTLSASKSNPLDIKGVKVMKKTKVKKQKTPKNRDAACSCC